MIQGRDGRLYGTTPFGGEFPFGTLYSIDLAGNYRVLHSFSGTPDGGRPQTDLVEASDGNLYGVSDFAGRLFRVDSAGTVTQLLVLSGSSPRGLIQGADGRLYGTTGDGQTIVTVNLQTTTLTTIHRFTAGESVGDRPNGVIQGRDGQFYGTSQVSGSASLVTTGTAFAMDATGARTTLHRFEGFRTNGIPMSNLFEGADGNLYGTTFYPDVPFVVRGHIFRMTPAGAFTTLSSADWLQAGVIQARDGRLYGTSAGGVFDAEFCAYGDVFSVEASGARHGAAHIRRLRQRGTVRRAPRN